MAVGMVFSLIQHLHSKLTTITLNDDDTSFLFCLWMRKKKG